MEMSRALQMVININWGVTIMDLMMNTTMAAKIIIFLVIVIIKVVVVDLGSQLGLPNLSWGPSIGQKSGVRGVAVPLAPWWHPVAPNGTRWQTAAVHEGGSTMAPPLPGSE